jgi:hypothetical protein
MDGRPARWDAQKRTVPHLAEKRKFACCSESCVLTIIRKRSKSRWSKRHRLEANYSMTDDENLQTETKEGYLLSQNRTRQLFTAPICVSFGTGLNRLGKLRHVRSLYKPITRVIIVRRVEAGPSGNSASCHAWQYFCITVEVEPIVQDMW